MYISVPIINRESLIETTQKIVLKTERKGFRKKYLLINLKSKIMEEEKWGLGNATQNKAFDTVKMGDEILELIHGEHPHSRQDNTTYAKTKHGSFIGFEGHRRPMKIEIEELKHEYNIEGEKK